MFSLMLCLFVFKVFNSLLINIIIWKQSLNVLHFIANTFTSVQPLIFSCLLFSLFCCCQGRGEEMFCLMPWLRTCAGIIAFHSSSAAHLLDLGVSCTIARPGVASVHMWQALWSLLSVAFKMLITTWTSFDRKTPFTHTQDKIKGSSIQI